MFDDESLNSELRSRSEPLYKTISRAMCRKLRFRLLFQENQITDNALHYIAQFIEKSPMFDRKSMRALHEKIHVSGVDVAVAFLKQRPTERSIVIQELNLGWNAINGSGIRHLVDSAEMRTFLQVHLKKLVLSWNEIDKLQYLAELMRGSCVLEFLDLRGNKIGSGQLANFLRVVFTRKAHSSDATEATTVNTGVDRALTSQRFHRYLPSPLPPPLQLTTLLLANNGICHAEDVEALAKFIIGNSRSTITELNLSRNAIGGSSESPTLFASLGRNKSLANLNLADNELTVLDMRAMAEVFKNDTLRELDLSGNPGISTQLHAPSNREQNRYGFNDTSDGCFAIAQMLARDTMTKLRKLMLSGCGLQPFDVCMLARALRHKRSTRLQHLDLQHNDIDQRAVSSLENMIRRKRSMYSVVLYGSEDLDVEKSDTGVVQRLDTERMRQLLLENIVKSHRKKQSHDTSVLEFVPRSRHHRTHRRGEMTIMQLPPEIIAMTCSFLSPKNLARAELVCSKFNQVIQRSEPSVWQDLWESYTNIRSLDRHRANVFEPERYKDRFLAIYRRLKSSSTLSRESIMFTPETTLFCWNENESNAKRNHHHWQTISDICFKYSPTNIGDTVFAYSYKYGILAEFEMDIVLNMNCLLGWPRDRRWKICNLGSPSDHCVFGHFDPRGEYICIEQVYSGRRLRDRVLKKFDISFLLQDDIELRNRVEDRTEENMLKMVTRFKVNRRAWMSQWCLFVAEYRFRHQVYNPQDDDPHILMDEQE